MAPNMMYRWTFRRERNSKGKECESESGKGVGVNGKGVWRRKVDVKVIGREGGDEREGKGEGEKKPDG